MKFMLRQLGLMARADPMIVFGRYYDLLLKVWPEVMGEDKRFEPEAVFTRHTGMTIERYFTLGFVAYSRFVNYAQGDAVEFPRLVGQRGACEPSW
jgi:hypothetical protein